MLDRKFMPVAFGGRIWTSFSPDSAHLASVECVRKGYRIVLDGFRGKVYDEIEYQRFTGPRTLELIAVQDGKRLKVSMTVR
jgi:hypothetical protein